MTLYVAPIVEGQTEQGCVERLLQRIWKELLGGTDRLQVLEPFRDDRSSLVLLDGEALRETVQKTFEKLKSRTRRDPAARSLLLILLDAEDDCPATMAPRLLQKARESLDPKVGLSCVLATRMLENWIVGGASTLSGTNELPDALPPRDRFEEIHGAKWLDQQLRSRNPRRKYKKTADAEPFVRSMNLEECRTNCPSFDKLCRELERGLSAPPPESAPSQEG